MLVEQSSVADSIKVPLISSQQEGTLAFLALDSDSALSMMKLDRNKDSIYGLGTCFGIGFTKEVTATVMFDSDYHLDNVDADYTEKIDSSVDSN